MKKVVKKISLGKKTISNLQLPELNKIFGGSTGCYPNYPQKTKNGKTCPGHNTCYTC